MTDSSANNKRIAKNTLLLYLRMGLLMVVSFYTSRVILKNLGFTDYGLYNVIAGFITMFGFLQGAMTNGIQRFVSYAIKRPEEFDVQDVYKASMRVLLLFCLVVLVLAETIGMWFLYNKLAIPAERMYAALWVFQLSLLQLIILLLSIPYMAIIVSYERMDAFAYISIFEVVCKLSVALLLGVSTADKLIFYACMMFLVQLSIRMVYTSYCHRRIARMSLKGGYNHGVTRLLLGYIGWNTTSLCSEIVLVQGINVLLNLFFGPAINAARGVAMQVMGVVRQFSVNFLMAVNPQIIKSYASGDVGYTENLTFQSSRFGFILMFSISAPILLITDDLLSIWLVDVPPSAGYFVQLIICATIINIITDPIKTAISATGKVKYVNIWMSVIMLMVIPLSYFFLKRGCDGRIVFVLQGVANSFMLFVCLYFLKKHAGISMMKFCRKVLSRILAIIMAVALVSFVMTRQMSDSFACKFWGAACVFVASTIISVILGMTSKERYFVLQKIKKKLQ